MSVKRTFPDAAKSTERVLKTSLERRKHAAFVKRMALQELPEGQRYSKSFMHAETISFVHSTINTNFVITASIDGHVKFWKSQSQGIEFVKDFKAHVSPIISAATTDDGSLYVTLATDKTAKVFDVANFDLMSILDLEFVPQSVCWISGLENSQILLAM